jgi:hypothetical protein
MPWQTGIASVLSSFRNAHGPHREKKRIGRKKEKERKKRAHINFGPLFSSLEEALEPRILSIE